LIAFGGITGYLYHRIAVGDQMFLGMQDFDFAHIQSYEAI